MCIALAITAARQGATIANHVRVTKLGKDQDGKVCSVSMKDELTGTIGLDFLNFFQILMLNVSF